MSGRAGPAEPCRRQPRRGDREGGSAGAARRVAAVPAVPGSQRDDVLSFNRSKGKSHTGEAPPSWAGRAPWLEQGAQVRARVAELRRREEDFSRGGVREPGVEGPQLDDEGERGVAFEDDAQDVETDAEGHRGLLS